MKLISSILASALSLQQKQTPSDDPNTCFAKNVDIDGALFWSNVVGNFNKVNTARLCQMFCQQSEECQFFIWGENDDKCSIYNSMSHIESAEDEQGKFMGARDGCLPCYREGWDYRGGSESLVGYGAVFSVPDVLKCAQLCSYSSECAMVSYHKTEMKCYLKTNTAIYDVKNTVFDENYQTATSGCATETCVIEDRNYENGWITSYDLIGRLASNGVPGVKSQAYCQQICRFATDCEYWTWDKEEKSCFLTKSAYYLTNSANTISGDRDCVQKTVLGSIMNGLYGLMDSLG